MGAAIGRWGSPRPRRASAAGKLRRQAGSRFDASPPRISHPESQDDGLAREIVPAPVQFVGWRARAFNGRSASGVIARGYGGLFNGARRARTGAALAAPSPSPRVT